MQTDEEYFAEFEKMGEPAVVAKICSGFAGKRLIKASAWKAAKDQERLLRMESSSSESLKTAKSAAAATLESAKSAREANNIAREANALASDANLMAHKSKIIAGVAVAIAIISPFIILWLSK